MKEFSKTVVVNYPASKVYEAIADVENYPNYIKWCDKVEVLSSKNNTEIVKLLFRIGKFKIELTTENNYVLNRSISMDIVEGPFNTFSGMWLLKEMFGENNSPKTQIEYFMKFELKNRLLALTLGKQFEKLASNFIDAFIKNLNENKTFK